MAKRQGERYERLVKTLDVQGFKRSEVDTLIRIERTLSTWAAHECNGEIQRDEETGKAYWYSAYGDKLGSTADRETGALKRAKALIESKGCQFYHQSDPRGCQVYVIRPGDVREGQDVCSCYTNGVAVCID